MGYTHYWKRKRDLTKEEFESLLCETKRVLEVAKVKGIGLIPDIGKDYVHINPAEGPGETFFIPKGRMPFSFCKTNHLPYDDVVVTILYFCMEKLSFEVTTDGTAKSIRKVL